MSAVSSLIMTSCFVDIYTEIGNSSDLRDSLEEYEDGLDLPTDVEFGLQHFSYNNSGVVNLVYGHLNETHFTGITVSKLHVLLNCCPSPSNRLYCDHYRSLSFHLK